MNDHKLYVLIDPRNNSVRYVGVTKSKKITRRLLEHLRDHDNPHKERWIGQLKKENIIPRILIIREQLSEDRAYHLEEFLIKFLKFKFDFNLVNIALGGNRPVEYDWTGKKHTQETKDKMKKSMTKDRREKISKIHKNKIVSCETKEKMSKNHADISGEKNPFYGKKHLETTKLKMRKPKKNCKIYLTIDGVTKTITEWSLEVKIIRHTIVTRLKRGWADKDSVFGKRK